MNDLKKVIHCFQKILKRAESILTEADDTPQPRACSASRALQEYLPRDKRALRWFLSPQDVINIQKDKERYLAGKKKYRLVCGAKNTMLEWDVKGFMIVCCVKGVVIKCCVKGTMIIYSVKGVMLCIM